MSETKTALERAQEVLDKRDDFLTVGIDYPALMHFIAEAIRAAEREAYLDAKRIALVYSQQADCERSATGAIKYQAGQEIGREISKRMTDRRVGDLLYGRTEG